LNTYSALPWPKWSVAPGFLTPRGYELLKRFGAYDRAAYAGMGLLSPKGCADASGMYIWADTDQRTIASGRALAESLYPGCAPEVHSLAEGENDPIFHPIADGVSPEVAETAFAQLSKRIAEMPMDSTSQLLTELQRVLLGCKPDADCTPAHAPEMTLTGKTAASRGAGDKFVTLKGPIPLGSTLSEDLLLEYSDGMPMSSVGWGHVDEAELSRLLALHSVYFDLIHQTPAFAKAEASGMLNHITHTLAQGAAGKAVEGAMGKPGDKLVIFAGHDTNIAGIGALLGLQWHLDGRDEDTPPGTELYFELWQSADGSYSVRTKIAMQKLHQLRELSPLTVADPPAMETLTPAGCTAKGGGCSWKEFLSLSKQATGAPAN
jgi:4-phytase/acid phosphatase